MATPTLSPYNTNGKVITGRTAMNGDYVSASVRAKAVSRELCAGTAQYIGLKTLELKPCITWADYPTGLIDIPLSNWNPTSAADSNIYASYTTPWRSAAPGPGTGVPIREIELRYYCILYQNISRMIVWMSEGGGGYYTGMDPVNHYFGFWSVNQNIDISASFTLNIDVSCKERVEIVQDVGSGNVWLWPDDCFQDGMGTTHATFDAVGDTAICSITIGSESISSEDMPSNFIGSLAYSPFTNERTIEGKAGLMTSAPAWFGWGDTYQGGLPYQMTNQTVFSELTQVSQMTLGTRESDLRFRDGQTYTGTDTNCEGVASDNSFEFKAINSPASASGAFVGTHAKWTDLGLSYKIDVDFAMMDGLAQGDATNIDPEFTEISSNTSWTGSTSDVIVYDGNWQLKMYELDGSIMDTRSTETDASGSGASWARSNAAPAYIQVRLDNPEDYNTMARSVYNEYTEQYETLDDKRVQFLYPREETGVSITVDALTELDGLNDVGVAGVGGWTAVNCTLTAITGGLRITDASAGAYIYRSDFMLHDDIRNPKHWPGQRFCQLTATAVDAASQAIDIDHLVLTVERTGGADTFSKSYTNLVSEDTTQCTWDICKPDGAGAIDTSESYIDLAKPLDTVCTGGNEIDGWVVESNELSALSDNWGIGAFDKVTISGFAAGNTYDLTTIGTKFESETYDNVTYVQAECDKERDIGDTALNDDTADNWQNHVWRHIIAVSNGRYAWEAPSVKVSKSPNYVVNNYSNYSLQDVFETAGNRWPVDDFGAYGFSLTAAFDSGDWDATDEEYTNERVLFNKDTCPMWFCLTKGFSRAEHDNAHDGIIKVAPLYDRVTLYPSWGDGTGTTARTGYCTIKALKRVRGRVNGILWNDTTFGIDTVDIDSAYSETATSDAQGYYRSGDHDRDANVDYDNLIATISPYSRVWSRVCLTLLPPGAVWLNACSSNQTGRAYVVYSLGQLIKVRIYDFGNKDYQDRTVNTTPPENSCGIAYTAGKNAGLSVVYDISGAVYRRVSYNEGKTWGSAVSIATGTNPQVCYCEKSKTEVVTYYAGSSIYAIIKKADGDFGSPILIAASDDAPASIAVCPGTRDYKLVCDVVQSGAIKRYVSTDDGNTWSLEE